MPIVKIVLAEDHALMRDAVRMVLEAEAELELVGEADNGLDLLPLVERTQPDVVLLDVQLPGRDGLACLEELRARHPSVRVVMLSALDDANVVASSFRRGAASYILKSINPFDLPAAIRQMLEGTVIHASAAAGAGARADGLSEKEVAVLAELATGCSNKEIARRLWLSEQTVKFHLRNVYRKLGITSRTEAVRYAYKRDLGPAQQVV